MGNKAMLSVSGESDEDKLRAKLVKNRARSVKGYDTYEVNFSKIKYNEKEVLSHSTLGNYFNGTMNKDKVVLKEFDKNDFSSTFIKIFIRTKNIHYFLNFLAYAEHKDKILLIFEAVDTNFKNFVVVKKFSKIQKLEHILHIYEAISILHHYDITHGKFSAEDIMVLHDEIKLCNYGFNDPFLTNDEDNLKDHQKKWDVFYINQLLIQLLLNDFNKETLEEDELKKLNLSKNLIKLMKNIHEKTYSDTLEEILEIMTKEIDDLKFEDFLVTELNEEMKEEIIKVLNQTTEEINFECNIAEISLTFEKDQNIGDRGAYVLGIALKGNTTLKRLKIGYNHITDYGISKIFQALFENESLEEFNVEGNQISVNEYAEKIGTFLSINKTLKILNLQSNKLSDEVGLSIANSMEKNNSIEMIYLSNNKFSDECGVQFAKSLEKNTTLKLLNFDDNKFTNRTAVQFGKSLKNNKNLNVLSLAFNQISDIGLLEIIGSLESNNLKEIYLGNNKITDEGVEKLRKLLENTKLEVLHLGGNSDISMDVKMEISKIKAIKYDSHFQ
eukprot:gene9270-1357_t